MRSLSKNILSSIFVLFLLQFAQAQTVEHEIDKLIQSNFDANSPGVAILVSNKDNIIYRKALGKSNLDSELDLKPEMVFKVGSITKQFTAVSILMLLEQGKLNLSDEITKYIPDYPNQNQKITIHHLLTHTSGIKNYTSLKAIRKLVAKELSPKEVMDVFKDEEMDFNSGEQFKYNNSGYILLGIIIEEVSGRTYGEFVQENIFSVLDMTSSSYGPSDEMGSVMAEGYSKRKKFKECREVNFTIPYSAGSILSSVDDMHKWQQAINNYDLVSKETLELAFTNHNPDKDSATKYGYGWFLNQANGVNTIEHGGDIFGFSSMEIYVPEHDVYVVLLTNCDCYSPTNIARRAAAIAIEKPYPTPEDSVELSVTQLEKYVGTYEFENGQVRSIKIQDGKLYSKRKDSKKEFRIIPYSENEFLFEGAGFVYYRFEDNGEKIVFRSGPKDFFGKRIAQTNQ